MMEVYVGAAVLAMIWLVLRLRNRKKKAHIHALLEKPLSVEHRQILNANFNIVNYFPEELQKKLGGLVNVFLEEKDFTGCGGLEITDEIRVTIAAQACLLLVNNKTQPWYNKLHTVLVYPGAYMARTKDHSGSGVSEDDSVRLGESWGGGSIVLSWNSSRKGGVNFQDGENVVIHEFAHQLDQVDGEADGIPVLESGCYASWAALLTKEYKRLVRKALKNKKTVLDQYGAVNEAEFFAVASECFFEKPRQMLKKHRELYEALQNYYGLDPVKWTAGK